MLAVTLLLLLNSTAAIQLRNQALLHAAHAQAQQPKPLEPYVVCNCSNVEWNRSVKTWSYDSDHPNLSVEYH